MRGKVVSSIRPSFPGLSQSQGQVTHVLLTRSPLIPPASWRSSFDLHVLSTPPAFILSQDQTLRKKIRTQHKPPGKRRTHAAQNSKPAKKPATPHGSTGRHAQENQKPQQPHPTHTRKPTTQNAIRPRPRKSPAPVASGPNSVPYTTEPATNQPFPQPTPTTPTKKGSGHKPVLKPAGTNPAPIR